MTVAISREDEVALPGMLARLNAPGGYDAFAAQVRAARCCRRPVRLKGRVSAVGQDGRSSVLFDSADLPDGVLLKACGTRRETVCPPCASIYRGDAFQLVAAGLRGGKGVPESITEHPAVLLTLTAPSFGPVHRRLPDGSCHRAGRRCPHGVLLVCGASHDEDDEALGQALCPHCYDYEAAVLWNATVSELWRRTTIYALRSLGSLAGMSVRQAAKTLRLSYVKVVEFQRRGSVHLHAIVRIDVRDDELGPPPGNLDGSNLAAALQMAARKVTAPALGGRTERIRWGRQVDVAVITDAGNGRRRAAAYAAKYATKGSDAGGALDHRLRAGVPVGLSLPAHLRALVSTAWHLGEDRELEVLRLRLWAHTCGFRGHFLTKSRRYSTTFGRLRADRQAWTDHDGGQTLVGTAADHDGVAVLGEWRFDGNGYLTAGDVVLASSLADDERRARRLAYEARWCSEGEERP